MDNDDRMRRGENAARILKDPLWEESWKLLNDRITALTMAAKTDEGTLRGKLLFGLAADLKLIWEGFIKDGAMTRATVKLDREERKWWQKTA